MKTIAEIASEIKTAFIANNTLAAIYGFDQGKTFDEQFAASSIEANLINVVAVSMATMDWQQESYKEDVEALILQTFPGTVAWYHALVLQFAYNEVNIVKYAAVVEQFPMLLIKVNGEDFAVFEPESLEMVALTTYLGQYKFAGTYINLVSRDPDDVEPTLTVWLDAQKFNSSGGRLSDSSTPVEDAIDAYLAGVVYNGIMNKTKLIDAIQAVDGVLDVELTGLTVTWGDPPETTTVTGNNYSSYGGGFVSTTKNITYVLG